MKIEQIPVGSMQVFSYLVYDEETKEGILIDPAGNEEDLIEHLREKGIKLRYIVNTHGHPDHTCGNEPIKKATGASVIMHAFDNLFYQRPEAKMFAMSMGFTTPGPADIGVLDGDELAFGNLKMKFIHTPGHTEGGCCSTHRRKPLHRGHSFCGWDRAHRFSRRIVRTIDQIASKPCKNASAGYGGVARTRLRGPATVDTGARSENKSLYRGVYA